MLALEFNGLSTPKATKEGSLSHKILRQGLPFSNTLSDKNNIDMKMDLWSWTVLTHSESSKARVPVDPFHSSHDEYQTMFLLESPSTFDTNKIDSLVASSVKSS